MGCKITSYFFNNQIFRFLFARRPRRCRTFRKPPLLRAKFLPVKCRMPSVATPENSHDGMPTTSFCRKPGTFQGSGWPYGDRDTNRTTAVAQLYGGRRTIVRRPPYTRLKPANAETLQPPESALQASFHAPAMVIHSPSHHQDRHPRNHKGPKIFRPTLGQTSEFLYICKNYENNSVACRFSLPTPKS